MARLSRILAVGALLIAGSAATAQAAGVAYLKDGQVWVSSLDGSKSVQLSTGDAWWNAVGQSSSGGIVATKNEPGKIAQLTQFAVWNPDGSIKDQGPASPGLNFSGSLAAPLGLELTADNRGIIYGFSEYVYGFPVGTLTTGYALLPTDTRVTPTKTLTNTIIDWPTLVAGRIIGSPDGQAMTLENAGGNNTGGSNNADFTAWPGIAITGVQNGKIHRIHSSDSGALLAFEIDIHDANNSAADTSRILMMKTGGLLGAYADDCWLPVTGKAEFADVAADGSSVVWSDADGVKIAGPPAFGGEADCVLTRPATLIAAGGKYPAVGPIDVDALYAARNPAPPAPTTTTPTPKTPAKPVLKVPAANKPPVAALPAETTAATLIAGTGTVEVAAGKAGKVTVTVTVTAKSVGRKGKAIVIATGTAKLGKAGQITVKLKATKAGKALKKKLKGRKVTLVIKAGGKTTRKTVTLK